MALLEVETLRTHFLSERGDLRAVEGVSFAVDERETVAIVGESGSGKSVTAMSILRLLDEPPARVTGRVMFEGQDLLKLSEPEMRKVRGNRIGMIFQEPMTSLNPVMTVGDQIAESVMLHQGASAGEAWGGALEMLKLVGIPAPERRLKEYPHLLSGGMRQRVMIAMALACNPKLLLADEPTTALDVTVQAQILKLMRELKTRLGSAIILITHDFGVVAEMADRVVIMYAGRKVEEAPTREIFRNPRHPYTKGLLGAVPRLGASAMPRARRRLSEIPGLVPNLRKPIVGCPFAPRCPLATEICTVVMPDLLPRNPGHASACHHAEQVVAA